MSLLLRRTTQHQLFILRLCPRGVHEPPVHGAISIVRKLAEHLQKEDTKIERACGVDQGQKRMCEQPGANIGNTRLTKTSRNTVKALPEGRKIHHARHRGIHVSTLSPAYAPASQLPFLIRYSRSIDAAHIDAAYVTFPVIEKRNSAGESPSHRVLKFLTGRVSGRGSADMVWMSTTYRSAVSAIPLTSEETAIVSTDGL